VRGKGEGGGAGHWEEARPLHPRLSGGQRRAGTKEREQNLADEL